MSAVFPVSAFEGHVFFLDGRFSQERREQIDSFIRQQGGHLVENFDSTVTIVLQERRSQSKYPDQLIRTFEDLIDLLGLSKCNAVELFGDEDSRHRLDQLPVFVFSSGFLFEVCKGSWWTGQVFRTAMNVESKVPWRLVDCSFRHCELDRLEIIGSLSNRLAVEGVQFTDSTLRHCRFAQVQNLIAERVTFEDCSTHCLSRINMADVRWLRGSLSGIADSFVRLLVVEHGHFPRISASELTNCTFAHLGHNELYGVIDNNLRCMPVSESTLKDCLLSNVRLDQFLWQGVTLCDLTFEDCEFTELVFNGCRLSGCRFQNVSASVFDMTDSQFENCVWEGPVPKIKGVLSDASRGIEWRCTDSSSEDSFSLINLAAMPEVKEFCEMFVARDNVKLDFNATTIDGSTVAVNISKLRLWEFSATGEKASFKVSLDDLSDKSPAGIARVLARLFQEAGITSVEPKGMKVKMTALSAHTPVIPAAEFKKLAMRAFDVLKSIGPEFEAGP